MFIAITAIVLCFAFVLLFGAPYLPTMRRQVGVALDLLDLEPGQLLLELGCGDGKVLQAAAQRGIRCVGYELNPLLVVVCWLRLWRYRRLVRVVWGNYWRADWPRADAVFGFILPKFMSKLDAKIISEHRGPLKVVSFAFPIPHKKLVRSDEGVYLYHYK